MKRLPIKEVMKRIKQGEYLEMHDHLIETRSIVMQYYVAKALKVVNTDLMFEWAKNTITSKHGSKRLFHNALTLYDNPPHWLKHCHKPEDGLKKLGKYIKIAKKATK